MTAGLLAGRARSDAYAGGQHGPRAARRLPPTRELIALLPPSWQPVHRAIRDTTPAWCERCDQPCRLPFGPGEGLCQPCRDGETADRTRSHR